MTQRELEQTVIALRQQNLKLRYNNVILQRKIDDYQALEELRELSKQTNALIEKYCEN